MKELWSEIFGSRAFRATMIIHFKFLVFSPTKPERKGIVMDFQLLEKSGMWQL
jgi:hypothetical protein